MPPADVDDGSMDNLTAADVDTFELRLGDAVIGTERGYGIDHTGATIAGALETAVPSCDPLTAESSADLTASR